MVVQSSDGPGFHENNDRIRKENVARERKRSAAFEKQEKRSRDFWNKQAAEQQRPAEPWDRQAPADPFVRDYEQSLSGRTNSKKGGSFGKVALLTLGTLIVLAYLASQSTTPSTDRTPPPNVVGSSPSPGRFDGPSAESTRVPPAQPDPAPRQDLTTAQAPAPQAGTNPPEPQPIPPQTAEPTSIPSLQLVNRVAPIYPQIAKQGRIQGTITITLEVGSNGSVIDARPEGGNPILAKAATDAALQWRYAPYAAAPGQPPLTTKADFHFNLQQ